MDILFIGQRGIPATGNAAASALEQRVEALSVHLARAGHRVAVTCARGFTTSSLIRYNGVELLHGSFSTFLCLLAIWRLQPTVVHTHGWLMGILLPLGRILSSSSTFIWTIESFPTRWPRFFAWIARRTARECAAVTVPSRSLQYLLLYRCNLRAAYVPDGYLPTTLDGPVTRFGVRKGQYALVFNDSHTDLSWVAEAYKASGTRKKLIVMKDPGLRQGLSKRRYPFLRLVGPQQGRALFSLVRNAAVVIFAADSVPNELVLHAMDMGRTVVAITHPLYESVMGTTARFVRRGNSDDLTRALTAVVTNKHVQAAWGQAAQRRARAHFQWPRVVADYVSLYRSASAYRISLDSVRQTSFTQLIPAFAKATADKRAQA